MVQTEAKEESIASQLPGRSPVGIPRRTMYPASSEGTEDTGAAVAEAILIQNAKGDVTQIIENPPIGSKKVEKKTA